MGEKVKIAVAGAGLAGAQHIAALARAEDAELAAIADPGEKGAAAARRAKVPHYQGIDEMLRAARPDGVVIATPTAMHPEGAIACAKAKVAALVEKPIAADAARAAEMIAAARENNAPLMVGHHRRHNPLVAAARRQIENGELGRLTVVHAQCWLYKPDDYFRAEWRKSKNAGPLFINAVHDIDLLTHLCGGVESVRAADSRIVRGFDAEESAALLLRFECGALGTMSVSDATVSPWSWELTAHENPAYPFTGESCYFLGGTRGSMSLPDLAVWQNLPTPQGKDARQGQEVRESKAGQQGENGRQGNDPRGWWQPISATRPVFDFTGDAIFRQMRQFAAVIRGEEPPLVPGEDALRALAIIEAAKQSAATGETVQI